MNEIIFCLSVISSLLFLTSTVIGFMTVKSYPQLGDVFYMILLVGVIVELPAIILLIVKMF